MLDASPSGLQSENWPSIEVLLSDKDLIFILRNVRDKKQVCFISNGKKPKYSLLMHFLLLSDWSSITQKLKDRFQQQKMGFINSRYQFIMLQCYIT